MGYYTQYSLEITHQPNTFSVIERVEQFKKNVANLPVAGIEQGLDDILKMLKEQDTVRPDTPESILSQFREVCESAKYALTSSGDTAESAKWYSHKEDLINFSVRYPDWLFTLTGEGEEAGDLWKLYVYSGKSQMARAQVKYDDFDLNKLQ